MWKSTQIPHRAAALALWGSLLFAGSSQGATLIGSTVTETAYYPTLSSLYGQATPATVGSGVEFPANAIPGLNYFETDITTNQIIFHPLYSTQFGAAQFNGLVLEFSGAPVIEGVTLDQSNVFPAVPFSFTSDTVTFNLSDLGVTTADRLILDVSFSKSVPETSTWAMLLAGFAALGLASRLTARRALAGRQASTSALSWLSRRPA
jgi:hypothetical protein